MDGAWQVLRSIDGTQGDWHGRHDTKESALEALKGEREGELRAAIATLSPVESGEKLYDLRLLGVAPISGRPDSVQVSFVATHGETVQRGQLLIGEDHYTTTEVARLAAATIREIAAGRLPPGTRSLL